MADLAESAQMDDLVAAECEACGRRFRARKWKEGMQCPKCDSGHVHPLVAPGGAVDYCVADRGNGYASADVRFAQWAKWTELITPNQYERAFVKQNRQIQAGRKPDPIHEIMVEEDWIAREQAIGLLEFMSLPRPDEHDGRFIRYLEHTTDADMEKVEKIRKLQMKAASRYHEVPPLCQLLMERRVLSEAQMLGILKRQEKNGEGLLAVARKMAGERKSTERARNLRKKVSLKNPTTRNVVIVLALLLLGLAAWHWQTGSGKTVMVKCRKCGATGKAAWTKSFPVTCPEKNHKAAYYAMICEEGHVFTVDNPYNPHITCPRCGTTNVRPLREEDLP